MGYETKEKVGVGTYGVVYRGVDTDTGEEVAMKAVDLERVPEDIEDLQREVNMMKQLSVPSVVEYYGAYVRGSVLWIIMEFMDGGSLDQLLQVIPGLPEDLCATILYDLLNGVIYLHNEGKLHRDLKCGNILVSRGGRVKLADFGVAGQLTQTKQARNTLVGSPYWTAPEVIKENNYDGKADVWSFGITALELAVGHPPYSSMHPMEALMLIPTLPPPRLDDYFSHDFQDLVSVCCELNPADRPTALMLREHHFFSKRIVDAAERARRLSYLLDEKDCRKIKNVENNGGDAAGNVGRMSDIQNVVNAKDVRYEEESSTDSDEEEQGTDDGADDLATGDQPSTSAADLWISLNELLTVHKTLSEDEIALLIKSIVRHLTSLHSEGIIVRNICLATVQLRKSGGRCIARLSIPTTDSKIVSEALLYTAPEAIAKDSYSAASDVWSVGALTYCLAMGECPYAKAKNPIAVMQAIESTTPPQLNDSFSQAIRDFVASCLNKSIEERPTASALSRHDFVCIDAKSPTGLLAYEALEVLIRRLVSRHPDADDNEDVEDSDFEDFQDVREDEQYRSFIRNIDFSVGLDWDQLEEELPDIIDYIGSEAFQQLLKRYHALVAEDDDAVREGGVNETDGVDEEEQASPSRPTPIWDF